VVDVQNDFMLPAAPGGRLYVHDLGDNSDPGAQRIVGVLVRVVEWMHANCDAVVYTGDWHKAGDMEIDAASPDPAKGTYPPHCMGASPDPVLASGAALIAEVAPRNEPVILKRDASGAEGKDVVRQALASQKPIFIQKSRFSVFEGNPAAAALVRAMVDQLREGGAEDVEFVVCGVATDVCVKAAVEGLLDYGAVTVVGDAVAGLGLEPDDALFAKWAALGAHITDSAGCTVAADVAARRKVTSVISGAAPSRKGMPQ
jgi:nicotinamidase-related amidase